MTQVFERQTATPTNAIALKAVQSQTEEAYTLGGVKDAKSVYLLIFKVYLLIFKVYLLIFKVHLIILPRLFNSLIF